MNTSEILLFMSIAILVLLALGTLLGFSISLIRDQYYGKGLFGLTLFLAFATLVASLVARALEIM